MATTQTTSNILTNANTIDSSNAIIGSAIQQYYDKKLLDRLISRFVHFQLGQKRPIPKNGGKTINFRKYLSFSAATTALTEGVTPNGKSVALTEKVSTVAQYGDFVEVSDILDMTHIDPVLDEVADILGEQAADTLDRIVRGVLAGGTNIQYANDATTLATIGTDDRLTVTELRKAVRTLKRNNVKPMGDGYYVAIVHPNTTFDLQGDTNWVNANQYAGSTNIFTGEIGRMYGIRFIETSNAFINAGAGASAADVYYTFIMGENAYGVVDVAGSGAVQNIVKPHGSAGTADPLNQRATSGWKAMFTAVILEQAAMVQVRHTVSG